MMQADTNAKIIQVMQESSWSEGEKNESARVLASCWMLGEL